LRYNSSRRLAFTDGTMVPTSDEETYLGAIFTTTGSMDPEINQRIRSTMAAWRKMPIYWQKATTPTRTKLIIFDTMIRSKLVYGLESAPLLTAQRIRLNALQLKGLRNILKLQTTYMDRANTNERVMALANERYNKDAKPNQIRTIKPFAEYIDQRSQQLLGHILRAAKTDLMASTTVHHGTLRPVQYQGQRIGRPRIQWLQDTLRTAWPNVRRIYLNNSEGENETTETIGSHNTPWFWVGGQGNPTQHKCMIKAAMDRNL